jgi:hypothetical protein
MTLHLGRQLLPLRLYPSRRISWVKFLPSLLGFGLLAIHNKLPGRLCRATQASTWEYPSRVPCLTGLVCACGVANLGFCCVSLCDQVKSFMSLWDKQLCICAGWFMEAYLQVGLTNLSHFSALLCCYIYILSPKLYKKCAEEDPVKTTCYRLTVDSM